MLVVTRRVPITVRFYDPASVASFAIPIGFYVDRLSAVMMTLITGVSIIIYCYSTGYMYQDRHARRYLAMICLTDFVLICMVSSANLMMLFLFWQLLSYLLYRPRAQPWPCRDVGGRVQDLYAVARRRHGVSCRHCPRVSTLRHARIPGTLCASGCQTPMTLSLWPGMEISAATAVTLLFFIGAMGKSAQFPLHLWLPGSLFAPTPVHALLHAGIINAGGFLDQPPGSAVRPELDHAARRLRRRHLTAVLGATMMLAQNDIKKTLGFSTIGQMGYMIMECGLGAFSLAVFHLDRPRSLQGHGLLELRQRHP